MRSTTVLAILAMVLGLTLAASAQRGNEAETLLGQGLHLENEGNCKEALAVYQHVLQRKDASTAVAARASLHIAFCRERLGARETEATYQALLERYPEQLDIIAQAHARLAVLTAQRRRAGRDAQPPSTRRVMSGTEAAYSRDWSLSRDGRYLTMLAGTDLAIRDLATNETRRRTILPGTGFPRLPILSPDHASVVYTVGSELRLLSTRGEESVRTLLASPTDIRSVSPLAWSMDGRSILVLLLATDRYLGVTPSASSRSAMVWVSATDGTLQRVLRTWSDAPPLQVSPIDTGEIDGADLSPDGRHIVYSARLRPDTDDRAILVTAADGSSAAREVVTTGVNRLPKWSPEGRHILFLSNRSGSESLLAVAIENGRTAGLPYVVKRDVGAIQPIGVTGLGSYYFAQLEGTSTNGVNVFVAEIDPAAGKIRGQPTYLTERLAGWNAAPGYSPDGRFVGFKRRRPDTPWISDLVVRTLESGEERTYAAPEWVNPAFIGAPTTWLHDGSGLLVGAEPLTSPGSARWLGRLDLTDGVFTRVLQVDATLGWMAALSPDDETVYMLHSPDARYLTVDGRNVTSSSYVGIEAVALASGRRRSVFTLSGGGTVNSVTLDRDGQTLAFFIYEDGPQRRTRLTTLSIDGSSRRDVYVTSKSIANRPDQIQWSKDGRSLLFIEEGRVLRIASQGATPPQFTGLAMTRPDRTHPISLSPDGSRIAFSDGAPWFIDREIWAIDNVLSGIDPPKP